MKKSVGILLVVALVLGLIHSVRAEEKDAKAVLDKAIEALGGEEKLSKAKVYSFKAKGKFGDNEMSFQTTVEGLDRQRQEMQGKFGENEVKGVTVVIGDKGWRRFNDTTMEIDKGGLAFEKRNLYQQVVSTRIVPLQSKEFKVELAGEEKVGDKPAVVVKVTGPDKKEFKILFDKESGLPVKQITTASFGDQEFTMELSFSNYKDFGGIKKATKIEITNNGQPFATQEISEFKVLDKVPADTFAEPK